MAIVLHDISRKRLVKIIKQTGKDNYEFVSISCEPDSDKYNVVATRKMKTPEQYAAIISKPIHTGKDRNNKQRCLRT
jgi:hypothetical protein